MQERTRCPSSLFLAARVILRPATSWPKTAERDRDTWTHLENKGATWRRQAQPIRAGRSIFLTATDKESHCGLVQQFTILSLHDWPRFRLGLACQRRKGTRDEKEDR